MNEQQNPLGTIITKALQDEAFKLRLLADPAAVLKAEGIEIPKGITLKVVADTENVRHIVLPSAGGSELSDGELIIIAGGINGGNPCVCESNNTDLN